MRWLEPTHKQTVNLEPDDYRRLLAAANGLGKGAFVELGLQYSQKAEIQAIENYQPSRSLNVHIVSEWTEGPTVLGAKLGTILRRLHHPELTPAHRDELLFDLPRTALKQHTYLSLREGIYPHEGLGALIELALKNINYRLTGIETTIDPISAPVDPVLYHAVDAKIRAIGLKFDSVLTDEILAILKRKL